MEFRRLYRELRARYADAPAVFESIIKDVYLKVLSPGSVAIDCGAHTGKHTLPMAGAVGHLGHVFAFEPITEKCNILERRLEAGGFKNVTLINAVLGDVGRPEVRFNYVKNDPGKSASVLRTGLRETANVQELALPQTTVDAECNRKEDCRFVKIDVEGAEFHVMRGLIETLKVGTPVIHFECGLETLGLHGAQPEEVFNLLRDLGYELCDLLGHDLENAAIFLDSLRAAGLYDYFAFPPYVDRRIVSNISHRHFPNFSQSL